MTVLRSLFCRRSGSYLYPFCLDRFKIELTLAAVAFLLASHLQGRRMTTSSAYPIMWIMTSVILIPLPGLATS